MISVPMVFDRVAAGSLAPTLRFQPHIADYAKWWEVIWNSGYRGQLEAIEFSAQARFRSEYVARVEELQTEDGIPVEMEVIIVMGTK